MRTTLNLDDDVARSVTDLSKRNHRSISRVVNDLLRAGLRARKNSSPLEPFKAKVFHTGKPLIDVTNVADALELLDRG